MISSGNIGSIGAFVSAIIGSSAFVVAAWVLILWRANHLTQPRDSSLSDIMIAFGLCLLFALPALETKIFALLMFSWVLLFRGGVTPNGRQAGLLLAILALREAWHTPYLHPLDVAVAHADAPVVAWLANHLGDHVTVAGKIVGNQAFSIDILAGCSSAFPLADVALGFFVVVIWFRGECRLADLSWLMLSLVASILLTELRLTLIVPNQMTYEFWHNGQGNTLYEAVALGITLLIPFLSCVVSPGQVRIRPGRELLS